MAHFALADGIAGLFNSERFSDLIIRCDDRKWYAHRSVVCTQSEFFQKACEGQFKEASSGLVDLEDDDPKVVDAFLMYLYAGNYSDFIHEGKNRSRAVFNVQVFALAEKFFVEPLLDVAAQKFNTIASNYGDGEDLADAIEEWARSAMDIHKILGIEISNTIIDNRSSIYRPLGAFSRVQELIRQIPWLATQTGQMLTLLPDFYKYSGLYRCPGNECKHIFTASIARGARFRLICQSCNRRYNLNWTGWEHFRVSYCIVGAVYEDEKKAEGDE